VSLFAKCFRWILGNSLVPLNITYWGSNGFTSPLNGDEWTAPTFGSEEIKLGRTLGTFKSTMVTKTNKFESPPQHKIQIQIKSNVSIKKITAYQDNKNDG
jgi:hypothetical protein